MGDLDIDRPLPPGLEVLQLLAADLSLTASQFAFSIWQRLDPEIWSRTQNPLLILRHAPSERFEALAADQEFMTRLSAWLERQQRAQTRPSWFETTPEQQARGNLRTVAYFSMEFMLGDALPIYSGGLGNVAGDQLKSASDLGVPVVGVGLLYQQGYFRQSLGLDGSQHAAFPFNDPGALQITPATDAKGRWPRVRLPLSGRTLFVRAWQARVGRCTLYLLDTNDPLNNPRDRAIAAHLYSADHDTRFLQELVLGVGGWQLLEKLGIDVDVCHLNEGHAALATLARAGSFAQKHGVPFATAWWATRAGNVFTTHTPVEAAFDRFDIALVSSHARPFFDTLGVPFEELINFARVNPGSNEPFNMAYLALRGSGCVNGVSQLHGEVSRELFAKSFPRWPLCEVPVRAITNGVHIGTWDSAAANAFWSTASEQADWSLDLERCAPKVAGATDEAIWNFRGRARAGLVDYVRERYSRQLRENGAPEALVDRARHVLDPNALTLGFARRFAGYKRPNLMLQDEARLVRLLADTSRPVQLIVAGKAHPDDGLGKAMVQRMAQFTMRHDIFSQVVFMQDYDMALAQCLTGGVDVWINNPVRGNEASGTSGMKVLVNGGLNLSILDGWWDEAYRPDVGWALGGRRVASGSNLDGEEATHFYQLLEHEVLPEFYARDERGVPRTWVARVRASMSELTPRFSSARAVREYTTQAYLPAAAAYARREANHGQLARELCAWHSQITQGWHGVRVTHRDAKQTEAGVMVHLHVLLGELSPSLVRVQLYADAAEGRDAECVDARLEGGLPGTVNGFQYIALLTGERPLAEFTPRIVPFHPDAFVPLEAHAITWG